MFIKFIGYDRKKTKVKLYSHDGIDYIHLTFGNIPVIRDFQILLGIFKNIRFFADRIQSGDTTIKYRG
jgi:hypothetical protein